MFNRKFGVELEFFMPSRYYYDELRILLEEKFKKDKMKFVEFDGSETYKVWNVHSDCTLYGMQGGMQGMRNVEISSPILSGQKGLDDVKKICDFLNNLGCKVNETCGVHVHVDTTKLKHKTKVSIIARYAHLEKEIDCYVAPNRRENNAEYSGPLSVNEFFFEDLLYGSYDGSKSFKVEPSMLDTIEFRQLQGTLDSEKVLNWVEFCVNFTDESIKVFNKYRRNKNVVKVFMDKMNVPDPLLGFSEEKKQQFKSLMIAV